MPGRFDPEKYETVQDRLKRFWADNPDGRVETEINFATADHKSVIVTARVWKCFADARPVATGIAQEYAGGSGANATSHVENAETSAIGRALANWKYSGDLRPSRDEMEKVNRYAQRQPAPAPSRFTDGRPAQAPAEGEIGPCAKCGRPVRFALENGKRERYNADGSLHWKQCGNGPTGYESVEGAPPDESDPFGEN